MKRILITGKNSFVGMGLIELLSQFPDNYTLEEISLRNDNWMDKNFSDFDVIFHVAGLAHQKETKSNKYKYYQINRDLAYQVAVKAKEDGVKQFIFLSSMSVYGIKKGTITKVTPTVPISHYGKSKLEAEMLISGLSSTNYNVSILRPPMIYGKGCKGNYPKLSKLALRVPLFPNIDNERSMLFINNLSIFVKNIIDNKNSGLFFPQNKEYINTTDLVKRINAAHRRNIYITTLFNPIVKIFVKKIATFNKIFGNLKYDKNLMENYDYDDQVSYVDSIYITES